MKKILLTLGTLAATITPVAAVIACGSTDSTPKTWQEKRNAEVKVLEDRVKSLKTGAETNAINALLPLLRAANTESEYNSLSSDSKSTDGLKNEIDQTVESLKDYNFDTEENRVIKVNLVKAATSEEDIKNIMSNLKVDLKDFANIKYKLMGIWTERFKTISHSGQEYKMMNQFYRSLLVAHDEASVNAIADKMDVNGNIKR